MCLFKFNSNDLEDMSKLTQTILSSKPGCEFWPGELDHMTSLMVTTFLHTSSSAESSSHDLLYLTVPGQPISRSYMSRGMLYPMPSIPTYRAAPLRIRRHSDGRVRVAVFNASLAGDTQEVIDSDVIISDSLLHVDEVTLSAMTRCCEGLVDLGVGLVACQRVIHPTLKRMLRRHNVLAMDRLGIHYIYSFQRLTGATLIGSYSGGDVSSSELGSLDDVEHVVIDGRS